MRLRAVVTHLGDLQVLLASDREELEIALYSLESRRDDVSANDVAMREIARQVVDSFDAPSTHAEPLVGGVMFLV